MKAAPNTPPDHAYHGTSTTVFHDGTRSRERDHRDDHGEKAAGIADQPRPGRRAQRRAQAAIEHLLGGDADAGAEREEIEEEMLH